MKQLAMMLICIVLMGLSLVSAEEEGLVVRVTSDQQKYEIGDTARITVYVENQTRKTVRNLNVIHHLPNGLVYASDGDASKTIIPRLEAGETAQVQIGVKKEVPKLTVKICSDKEVYKDTDIAALTVIMENTSDVPIRNIDLAHILPNGLIYANGSSGQNYWVDELKAQETAEIRIYVKKAALPPKTGDYSMPEVFWEGMTFVAIWGLIWLKRKEREE